MGVRREGDERGIGAFFPVCAKAPSLAAADVIMMIISMNESFDSVPLRKQLRKPFKITSPESDVSFSAHRLAWLLVSSPRSRKGGGRGKYTREP